MISLVLLLVTCMKYTGTVTHRNTHAVYDIVCLNGDKSLTLGGEQVKGKLLQIGQHFCNTGFTFYFPQVITKMTFLFLTESHLYSFQTTV